ncbi:hypothetical protein [uncultured Gammaproteobacteria bacterium]|nr:hypothetical protein [uncultured Gammaproteobacteria bacterium]
MPKAMMLSASPLAPQSKSIAPPSKNNHINCVNDLYLCKGL